LDTKPKNIASLRGYSYDEAALFNHQAIRLDKYHVEEKKSSTDIAVTNIGYPIDARKVLECIAQIEDRRIDITTIRHPYDDWFSIGCNFASCFKENGRSLFHRVSRFYHRYDFKETDDQFDKCLAFASIPSLDTFFRRCEYLDIRFRSNNKS
jgi:hypothetical protein